MAYLETTPTAALDYREEKKRRIDSFATDVEFRKASENWRIMALERKYMNSFSWLGRPLIQLPTDVLAMQDIIWNVRPELIIETGVAHGGSLMVSASVLELLGRGDVVGIDIEIREHNRQAITNHPLSRRITLIEGSSVDKSVVDQVKKYATGKSPVLVFLDSNHTHEHVLAELDAYGPLVTKDSYIVVFDTFVEDLPESHIWADRPWGKGNNPRTAVWEWLKRNDSFDIDRSIEDRLLITSAPDGFLRRTK